MTPDEVAARDEDNPAAQAINDLWEAVILKYKPDYGDWEYPGQAFRHLRDEFESLRADLARKTRALEEHDKVLRFAADAATTISLNFARMNRRTQFMGDDEHESWTLADEVKERAGRAVLSLAAAALETKEEK